MNRYKLLERIAAGGMGEVFLARSEGPRGFSKTLVIKRILSHLASEPQFVEMFLNEARLAALLTHPNIVQIYELGEEEGSFYIAMEYIHGRTLRAIKRQLLQKRQLLSPVFAARVCAQALQGLHYAHTLSDDAGNPLHVVHSDVSADNVLVGFNGQVKLVDFGIAKAANAISTTRTGTMKGKFSYMAPEQLLGQHVDARTDVYAMGVILFELLTGARPWVAPTEPALINSILNTPPPVPRERNPSLPEAINDLILRALEKDPAARFSSAEEMSLALERFVAQSGQELTTSQIGAFLQELFGPEGAAPPSASSGPSSSSSMLRRPLEAGTPRTVPPAEDPTAVLTTPISTGARRQVRELATAAAPAGAPPPSGVHPPPVENPAPPVADVATTVAKPKAPPPSAIVPPPSDEHAPSEASSALPSGRKSLRTGLAVGGIALLFIGALIAAYAAGRGDSQPAEQRALTAAAPAPSPAPASGEVLTEPAAGPADEGAEAVVAALAVTETTDAGAEAVVAQLAIPQAAAVAPPNEERPQPRARPERRRTSGRNASAANGAGRVALRISPWAEVVHDGKSLGITPMPAVTVPSGRQTFTLRNKDLGVTRKVTVTVPPGGEVVLRADLFE